jgi:outer membrane receptor protein involved in Fe transport
VKALEISFAGSVNNWEYTKDVSGLYKDYDEEGNPDVEYNFYTNGLKVGDAPQTQGVLALAVFPVDGLRAELVAKFYADHYADFDPFSRTDETDKAQVWKTPSYSVFDFHASYDLPLDGDVGVQVFAHIFNLFDDIYVQDATDNSRFNGFYGADDQYSHEAWTAEVFLGIPRMYNFGVIVNL